MGINTRCQRVIKLILNDSYYLQFIILCPVSYLFFLFIYTVYVIILRYHLFTLF